MEDGLMNIKIREPTEEERSTCVRLTLTNDKPWTVGDNDDCHTMTTRIDFGRYPQVDKDSMHQSIEK